MSNHLHQVIRTTSFLLNLTNILIQKNRYGLNIENDKEFEMIRMEYILYVMRIMLGSDYAKSSKASQIILTMNDN